MKTASIQIATKQLVDSLLAINTNNRPIRKGVVDRYKRDIQSGNWIFTNQGIGISEGGTLVDGQHRLQALKEAGYPPIEILVVRGISEDAAKAIDQHAKRSMRDILAFSFDARVSRGTPGIANVIYKSSKNWSGMTVATASELLDIVADYQDEILFAVRLAKSHNFYPAPCLAAFAIAAKTFDQDKIAEFARSVEDGEMLAKNNPAYHLRNFIVTGRMNSGGSLLQKDRFEKTMKSLTAYCENKEMKVLRL